MSQTATFESLPGTGTSLTRRFKCYKKLGLQKAVIIDTLEGGLLLQPKPTKNFTAVATRDVIAQISSGEVTNLIEECERETIWFFFIFGKLNLASGTTLILITHANKLPQAFQDGRTVYKIQEVKFVQVAGNSVVTERKMFDDLKELLQDGSFFFCPDGDLSLNSQRYKRGDPTDSQYIWNRSLLKDFDEAGIDKRLSVRAIRGYVGFSTVYLKDATIAHIWLISRSSCGRAGTRFQTRGVDDDGYVANFAETEQLVQWEGWSVSHVQIRGTVPLFWEQPGINVGKHRVKITRSLDAMMPAFARHFQSLKEVYGSITVCNLLGQGEGETLLSDAYVQHCQELAATNTIDLSITCLDYHTATKSGRIDKVTEFIDLMHNDLVEKDIFLMDNNGRVIRQQRGVVRTNCLDCLDRTNAIMQPIGIAALELQLAYLPNRIDTDPKYVNRISTLYKDLWFDNGDRISLNYAGTGAIKADFAKLGKRTNLGMLKDGAKSMSRLYLNNYKDVHRQAVIDKVLGNLSIEEREDMDGGMKTAEILRGRENEFVISSTVSVYVATYNVNGGHCNSEVDLKSWLVDPVTMSGAEPPDIYAIGFQEIVNIDVSSMLKEDAANRQLWEKWLKSAISAFDCEYVQVVQQQLVGVCLYVFVKKELYPDVRDVVITSCKVGVHGLVGNKGGVAGRFRLRNTTFCFVCAHLAAGQSNVNDRQDDYADITNGIDFQKDRKIMNHDYVFWFGDFNFRIDLPIEEVKALIAKENWEELLDYDQLTTSMRDGLVFNGFTEGPVDFCPTYKYDVNSDVWDSSEKMRIPAWTDRVLYYRNSKHSSADDTIELLDYNRAELTISDHRPVYAVFEVDVVQVDKKARKKLYHELLSTRTKTTIVVSGLPERLLVECNDLRSMFTPIGRIVMFKPKTGTGAVHIKFSTEEEAASALLLSGSKFKGHTIICQLPGDGDGDDDTISTFSRDLSCGDFSNLDIDDDVSLCESYDDERRFESDSQNGLLINTTDYPSPQIPLRPSSLARPVVLPSKSQDPPARPHSYPVVPIAYLESPASEGASSSHSASYTPILPPPPSTVDALSDPDVIVPARPILRPSRPSMYGRPVSVLSQSSVSDSTIPSQPTIIPRRPQEPPSTVPSRPAPRVNNTTPLIPTRPVLHQGSPHEDVDVLIPARPQLPTDHSDVLNWVSPGQEGRVLIPTRPQPPTDHPDVLNRPTSYQGSPHKDVDVLIPTRPQLPTDHSDVLNGASPGQEGRVLIPTRPQPPTDHPDALNGTSLGQEGHILIPSRPKLSPEHQHLDTLEEDDVPTHIPVLVKPADSDVIPARPQTRPPAKMPPTVFENNRPSIKNKPRHLTSVVSEPALRPVSPPSVQSTSDTALPKFNLQSTGSVRTRPKVRPAVRPMSTASTFSTEEPPIVACAARPAVRPMSTASTFSTEEPPIVARAARPAARPMSTASTISTEEPPIVARAARPAVRPMSTASTFSTEEPPIVARAARPAARPMSTASTFATEEPPVVAPAVRPKPKPMPKPTKALKPASTVPHMPSPPSGPSLPPRPARLTKSDLSSASPIPSTAPSLTDATISPSPAPVETTTTLQSRPIPASRPSLRRPQTDTSKGGQVPLRPKPSPTPDATEPTQFN